MRAPTEHRKKATMPHPLRPTAPRPPADCGHRQPLPAVAVRQQGVALFVVIVFVLLTMLVGGFAVRRLLASSPLLALRAAS